MPNYFNKLKITGNGGAILDGAPGAAAPANALQIGGTDGTNLRALLTSTTGQLHVIVDTAPSTAVTGTFFQATQPVSIADGQGVTLGAKADAKSTATDTTAVSIMQVLKEISFMEQTPASRAVTNGGTFAVQAALNAETTKVIGTINVASGQVVGLDGTKTSGGMGLPYSASLTGTKAQIKGSAGQLYGWTIVNNGSALCYVQVFNKASASVTVGTTAPDFVIPIPAPSSGTNGAGIAQTLDLGIAMGTGITVACTTTRTGSTTVTCDVLFYYN
jgi:hypothetical protein